VSTAVGLAFVVVGAFMGVMAALYQRARLRVTRREQVALRQADEAVRASEAMLRLTLDAATVKEAQLEAVFQAMKDGVAVFDMSGRAVLVNEAEARINGFKNAAEMKKSMAYFAEVYEISDLQRRPIPLEQWPVSRVLRGESVVDWELRGRRRDTGQEWFFSFSGEPVRDASGTQVLAVVITRDITGQRRTEEQFRQAQKLESIGRLAGGVAHDFNNLLVGILGYAEFLGEGIRAGHPSLEDLAEIRKAGERARDLTRQLLAVARRQVGEPRPIDPNEVLNESERLLRRVVGEDVNMRLRLEPGVGTVFADPSQLQQVVMNLAVNARDAMPRGGSLTIETSSVLLDERYSAGHVEVEPGPYVMIAVSDSGEGMTPETQAHLFEPFFTTKPLGHGTGLGLATVHGIVKQAGGHIWVYSELGKGTTFKIYLPLRPQELARARSQAPRPIRGGHECVLVVEDDASARTLALRALQGAGYEVLAAANGREALEVAAAAPRPPHLVLTDVVMPEMSGKQVADALSRQRPALRVLYVSGYTQDTVVHHGVLDSVIDFLPKPYTPSALLARVRQVLDAG
jgi:PAS domain S-box-containing protein